MGTLEYVVKRCKSISFAADDIKASTVIPRSSMTGFSKIFITDPDALPSVPFFRTRTSLITNWDDAIPGRANKAVVYIRLGKMTRETVQIPHEGPYESEIKAITMDKYIADGTITAEHLELYKETLLGLLDDSITIEDIDRKFQLFLATAYLKVTDTAVKLRLLDMLQTYPSVVALETSAKPIYHEKVVDVIRNTNLFSDIFIANEKPGTGATAKQHSSMTKMDMLQAAVKGSVQLSAFNTGKVTVITGRGPAGISTMGDGNDYTVIDSLSRNGVVCIPRESENPSLDRMTKYLKSFEEFHIVFIHPALRGETKHMSAPCEEAEPDYLAGEGELCAICYCVITRLFFPCCTVEHEIDTEWKYAL